MTTIRQGARPVGSEKQLMASIVAFATLHGWWSYHTYDSRRSAAGFPDLVLLRRSRMIFAEIKGEKGRLSTAQAECLEALRTAGAETYIWRPADWHSGEVEAVLQ